VWKSDAGAGTFGAALGAGIGLALLPLPWWAGLLAAAAATGLSLWSAVPFAAGGRDPGWVCMDETAGTLLALIGLGGLPWLAALIVARVFDIVKIAPGVRRAEGLPGSVGVTADDLVSGAYGLGVGWLLVAAGL